MSKEIEKHLNRVYDSNEHILKVIEDAVAKRDLLNIVVYANQLKENLAVAKVLRNINNNK